MSLSPCDVVVSVSERLEGLGYSFHENFPEGMRPPGCVDDEDGCWFCWSAGGDIEVGETRSDSLAAVMDAMDHLAKRVAPMEAALKALVANAPEKSPGPEDYDDMESAFSNGGDCAAYVAGEIADRGLSGLMPEDVV